MLFQKPKSRPTLYLKNNCPYLLRGLIHTGTSPLGTSLTFTYPNQKKHQKKDVYNSSKKLAAFITYIFLKSVVPGNILEISESNLKSGYKLINQNRLQDAIYK